MIPERKKNISSFRIISLVASNVDVQEHSQALLLLLSVVAVVVSNEQAQSVK